MTYNQISLKLPKEILQRLDMEAKSRYKKRSEMIREAIFSYIGVHKELSIKEKLKDDELLKKWMKNTVDIGKTHAVKEHDTVF